jgi:hypothetical protein
MGQQHRQQLGFGGAEGFLLAPGLVRVLLPGSKRQPANSATRWAGSAGSTTCPG